MTPVSHVQIYTPEHFEQMDSQPTKLYVEYGDLSLDRVSFFRSQVL
jgi:hypothetical protein